MVRNLKEAVCDETNDLVYLLERQYATSGLRILRRAANELRRLHALLEENSVSTAIMQENEENNIVIRTGLILKVSAKYFGVDIAEILSERRTLKAMVPRHITMYLARELTSLSYPQIGACFNRDHTTVLYACDKITQQVASNSRIKTIVDEISALCREEAKIEYKRNQEAMQCLTAMT
jgi:chromosomal replication initiation ATPase DnaA